MNAHKFMVEEIRFHLSIPDTLVFTGWFYDGSTKDHTLTVQLDGRDLSVVKLLNKGVGVSQKYIHCVNEISEEVIGICRKTGKKGAVCPSTPLIRESRTGMPSMPSRRCSAWKIRFSTASKM